MGDSNDSISTPTIRRSDQTPEDASALARSAVKIAAATDLSVRTVQAALTGRGRPRASTLRAIREAADRMGLGALLTSQGSATRR